MRIPLVIFLVAWAGAPAFAYDAEKEKLEQGQDAALSDGRFELEVTQMPSVPMSLDGRFKLDSGFDPEATQPVSDGRYTLASELRSKSTFGACNAQPENIFANSFEGP